MAMHRPCDGRSQYVAVNERRGKGLTRWIEHYLGLRHCSRWLMLPDIDNGKDLPMVFGTHAGYVKRTME